MSEDAGNGVPADSVSTHKARYLMLDENTFAFWQDKTVVDRDGEKIGASDDLYLDEATDRREWLIVETGLFGRTVVVPAGKVVHQDDRTVQVPFSRRQVRGAAWRA